MDLTAHPGRKGWMEGQENQDCLDHRYLKERSGRGDGGEGGRRGREGGEGEREGGEGGRGEREGGEGGRRFIYPRSN